MMNKHSFKQPTRINSWLANYCLEDSRVIGESGKGVSEGRDN